MIDSYENLLSSLPVVTQQQQADELTAWQNSLLEPDVYAQQNEIASQMLTPEEIAKKKNERLAKKNLELSDDTNFTIGAKELYNKVNNLWDGDDLKVNIGGKQYGTSNKIFEDVNATMEESLARRQELIDQYNNAEDDPNARHKVYQLRLLDGYDQNGNPLYVYKTGIAETSAAERYKNQYIRNGYEILSEKGFAGAEEWENKWHGLKSNLADRTFDEGRNESGQKISQNDLIGAGYSEVYNTQQFGFDVTPEQLALNKQLSENLSRQKAERRAQGYGSGSDSIVDAFQSGLTKTAVDFADTALDIVTPGDNTWLNEAKKQENIDSWVGYNRVSADKAIGEATGYFNQGQYASALWQVLKEPQIVAESLPMMLEMTVGFGKFTKAGKLASELANANKLGNTAKATEISSKIANELTDANKAMYKIANNAGFLSAVTQQTNNDLDERIANSSNNEGASLPETMAVFASNFALLGLDRLAFDKITGIEGGKMALGNAFAMTDAFGKKKILSGIAQTAAGLAASGATEGAQEYVQTWGQILNQQLGTNENDGSFEKIISSKKNIDEAIGGMLAGTAGGAQMRSGSNTIETAANYISGKTKKDDFMADVTKRSSYAFDPNFDYLNSDEYKNKGDAIDRTVEKARYKMAMEDAAPKLFVDSLFGGKPVQDSTGSPINNQKALDGLLDSIKSVNMHTDEELSNFMKAQQEAGLYTQEKIDELTRNEQEVNTEKYINSFMNTYEKIAKQINKESRNVSDENRTKALDSVTEKMFSKINSEPDIQLRDRMYAEFINRFIDESSKETIFKNVEKSSSGEIKNSTIYGSENGKEYLDSLKEIQQKVFGSLPPEDLNQLNSYKELNQKISMFEQKFNDYNEKLKDLQAQNKTNLEIKTILDAKTSDDVQREILDGSGFIINPLKPSKDSISGHMRKIRNNINSIKDDINGTLEQSKDNKLNSILLPVNRFLEFANSRNRNNNAYDSLLNDFMSGNISENTFAEELAAREDFFDKVRKNIVTGDEALDSQISKARKEGLPVYRLGLDINSKTSERMITEAQSFIDNLKDVKRYLEHNIQVKEMLKKSIEGKRGLGKSIENINKSISVLQDKLDSVNASISAQEYNISYLSEMNKLFKNNKVLRAKVARELGKLFNKSENIPTPGSENVEQNVQINKDSKIDNIQPEQNIQDFIEPEIDTEILGMDDEFIQTNQNEEIKNATPNEQQRNEQNDGQQSIEQSNDIETIREEDKSVRSEEETSRDGERRVDQEEKSTIEEKREKTKLEIAIEKFEQEIDSKDLEINNIDKQIKDLKDELKNIQSAEKNLSNLSEYQSLLESSISELDKKIESKNNDISEFDKEIKALQETRKEIPNKDIKDKITGSIKETVSDKINSLSEVKKLSKQKSKNQKMIEEISLNINKLKKIVGAPTLTEFKKQTVKFKIFDLQQQIIEEKYNKDSDISKIHLEITDKKKEIYSAKLNNVGNSELSKLGYELKALNRRFQNEKFIDNSIRTKTIEFLNRKISQLNLKIEKAKSENLKVGLSILEKDKSSIEKILNEFKNENKYFNLLKNDYPGLVPQSYKLEEFLAYEKLQDDFKSVVKLNNKKNIYSGLSEGTNRLEGDKKTARIIENYFKLKGSSYRSKIDIEYPIGSTERQDFENTISSVIGYILNSDFTNKNDIIRSVSSKLDENGERLFEGNLNSLDNTSTSIEYGNIVTKSNNEVLENVNTNLLGLIFGTQNKDGVTTIKIPNYAENIIKLESWKEFGDMYSILETNLFSEKEAEDFDSIWGLNSSDEDIESQRMKIYEDYVVNGIIPQSVIIRSLGSRIYNALPITLDKNNLKLHTEDELIVQLGLYAISQFENGSKVSNQADEEFSFRQENGLIEVNDRKLNAIILPMDNDAINTYRTVSDTLSYLNLEQEKKTPKFKPITSVPETVKHRKTKLSDTAIETIKDYQSVAYKFTNNVTDLYNLWKKQDTRELAYQYLNISDDVEDFSKMTVSEIRKTLSKNRNERLEFDNLMRFYEEAGTDKEFYLPWEFVASGRYMDDSSVSLQRSKITRFLISTQGTRTEIDIKNIDGKPELDESIIDGINRSIAQAFDYGLDKDLDSYVIEKMNKDIKVNKDGSVEFGNTQKGNLIKQAYDIFTKALTLTPGSEEYIQLLKDGSKTIQKINKKGINGEPEFEGFHAVQTLRELANLKVQSDNATIAFENGANNYKYDSHFVTEADGITSGMMITLAQIMTDDAVNLLEKGGIYTNEAREFWTKIAKKLGLAKELESLGKDESGNQKITHGLLNRIGKMLQDSDNKSKIDSEDFSRANFSDFYNTVARHVDENIKSMISNLSKKGEKEFEKLSSIDKISNPLKYEKQLKKYTDLVYSVSILNFLDKKKISRSMAKDPVMVFIYGSSIGSIKNKILNGLLRSSLESELKKISLDVKAGNNVEISEDLSNILNGIGINYDKDFKVFSINKNIKAYEYDEKTKGLKLKKLDRNNVTLEQLGDLEISAENMNNLSMASNNSIGALFEDAFDANFDFINGYRDIIKSLEVIRFSVFDQKFEERVEQLISENSTIDYTYNPTNQDLDVILQGLINDGYGHVIRDINGGYHTFEKSERVDSLNRTSIRVQKTKNGRIADDTSLSGSVDIRQEVINLGAAPVTSIHNQDGWQIRYATLKDEVNEGIQNVFDAVITGLNNHNDAIFNYNEGFSKANTLHSILITQLEDMQKTIESLGQDGLKNVVEKAGSINDKEKSKKMFEKLIDNEFSRYAKSEEQSKYSLKEDNENYAIVLNNSIVTLKNDVQRILNGLSNKIENVSFGHLYSVDNGKQFNGQLGGFKIPKNLNIETIFNAYNDIMVSIMKTVYEVEPTYSQKPNPNFDYNFDNKLRNDEKAKNEILKDVQNAIKSNFLTKEQKEQITEIIDKLINC